MKTASSPGVLTWLATVVVTGSLLFLFHNVLWLVVPALLALVLYYCLRPLIQALVRKGLKHRTAAMAVTAILFLATLLAMVLFLPAVATHASGWKEPMLRYLQGGLSFVVKTEALLAQKLPLLRRQALFENSAMKLDAIAEQFAEKYLGSLLLQNHRL